VRQSVGKPGTCWDNSVAESFFATLKTELIYRQIWPSRRVAKSAIFEFIAGWYNQHRRHSTLGYLSPSDVERRTPQLPSPPNRTLHQMGSSPQDNVGGLRRGGARLMTEDQTDAGLCEGRRIVDAVADHGHYMACRLARTDQFQLEGWCALRIKCRVVMQVRARRARQSSAIPRGDGQLHSGIQDPLEDLSRIWLQSIFEHKGWRLVPHLPHL